MNLDKYEQYRANLPVYAQEIVIPGGNHAQFGSYGKQDGDGAATIPPVAQLVVTAEALIPVLTGAAPAEN